jgi:hypothetical protein
MHPDVLRQLAAEHARDLIADAGRARRVREARRPQWRRLAAQLRRSAKQTVLRLGSRRGSTIPVTPAADSGMKASR